MQRLFCKIKVGLLLCLIFLLSGNVFAQTNTALFVVGTTTLSSYDTKLKTLLESQGFTVVVKDDDNDSSADANGKDLIVISESVSSSKVMATYLGNTVPMVSLEVGIYDDMKFVSSSTGNKGNDASQTQISIVDTGHPLAAGLTTGAQTITSTSSDYMWGIPNANADIIATAVGDGTHALIFAYEEGDGLFDSNIAAARRVGWFIHSNSNGNFTANGDTLFKAAINWAISSPPTDPVINASVDSLLFNYVTGGSNPTLQSIVITNAGGGVLNWGASESPDVSWLTLAASGGSAGDSVTASVNPASLANGTYSTNVQISATGATNTPLNVPVKLNITSTSSLDIRVVTSSDDAEEKAGTVGLISSDLELAEDAGTSQTVGVRFSGINIPQGATVTNAYIQFKAKNSSSAAASLNIKAEASDNASTFNAVANNITNRTATNASISWNPSGWTAGAAGADEQTSDISSIVNEVVNRAGWLSGNALVVIIDGSGYRNPYSYDGDSSGAPLLHVEYNMSQSGQPPLITSQPADATVTEGDSAVFNVVASGTASITYQWQKNGADITGATDSSYTLISASLSDDNKQFRCIASNTAGSDTSAIASLTVSPLPPSAPDNLNATVLSGSQIDLSWVDNSDNEVGFIIERKTTASFTDIDTVAANVITYGDSGLQLSTSYTYRLRAYNSGGESGYSTEVVATTSSSSDSALLVVKQTPLSNYDNKLKALIESQGFTVVVVDDDFDSAADADGKELVVISETISASKVTNTYRDVAVPIICVDGLLYGDMKLTGATNDTDFGADNNQTQINIIDSGHLLAGGLSVGLHSMTTTSTYYYWGLPNANAATIATTSGNSSRSSIFAYEKGAGLFDGYTAAARRVAWFMHKLADNNFTSSADTLFIAAINWATTIPPSVIEPMLAVSPNSLEFVVVVDSIPPASQLLTINNSGNGTLNWTATRLNLSSWFSLTDSSGTDSGQVTVSVDTTGLTAGVLTDTIRVTDAIATNSPFDIPVIVQIYVPELTVSADSLNTSGEAGGANPSALTLDITNTGRGTLNWSAVQLSQATWLSLSDTIGTGDSQISLNINIINLSAGTYRDTVRISDNIATNSPIDVPIRLTLTQPIPGFVSEDEAEDNSGLPNSAWTVITNDGEDCLKAAVSSRPPSPDPTHRLNYDFDVPAGVTEVYVFAEVDVDNSGSSDSYWVDVNQSDVVTWNNLNATLGDGWQRAWVYSDGVDSKHVFSVNAGQTNTLNLYPRDPDTKINWIVIASDSTTDIQNYVYGSGGGTGPPVLTLDLSPTENANIGASVTFAVTATGAQPFAYQWQYNGVNIGGNLPTYTISNVAFADSGDYHCIISNSAGTLNSQVSRLNVFDPTDLDRSVTQWKPYLEWSLNNSSPSNTSYYDIIANATFTHSATSETITTGMFYDSGTMWKFRFTGTKTGTWTFTTSCATDTALAGKTGTVTVSVNPDANAAGFVTSSGNKWYRQGVEKAFVPQYVMYDTPDQYRNNPTKIDADIQTYINEHGFTGFHTTVFSRWFDINEQYTTNIPADPNPDPATFEALELLIAKVNAAGGSIHIWQWGDAASARTPTAWGINGSVDQRLQRYIAARLGPLPGWTMGLGYDLDEWITTAEITAWRNYMQQEMGWLHMLGGRPAGPNGPVFDHSPYVVWNQLLDYSSYEHHEPTYAAYVDALAEITTQPVISEDRFRIRSDQSQTDDKDYTEDDTRRGLWQSAMAGGVANIWGNFRDASGAYNSTARYPYNEPLKSQIKTYSEFINPRFATDLAVDNVNTSTSGNFKLALRSADSTRFIFYIEDSDNLPIDLTVMAGSQPAVLIDTKQAYSESFLGVLNTGSTTLQFGSTSDWAVAVGNFGISTVIPPIISTQPSAQTVYDGEWVGFEVGVTNSQGILYQWQRDGVNISNSNDSLLFVQASSVVSGFYRCILQNAAGSDTSDAAELVVNTLPQLVSVIDQGFDAGNGGGFYFDTLTHPTYSQQNLGTEGNPNFGIGMVLGGVDNTTYTTTNTSELLDFFTGGGAITISVDYKLSHSGYLESDEYGEVAIALDDVYYGANGDTIIAHLDGDGNNNNGGTVFTTGWQTYTVTIPNQSNSLHEISLIGLNNQKTTIDEKVTVLFDNIKISVSSQNPTITNDPNYKTVTEGQPTAFSVAANASGTLSYQWQVKSSTDSTYSDVTGATDSSYVILAPSLADSNSSYRCNVMNTIGADTASATSYAAVLTVTAATITPATLPVMFDFNADAEGFEFFQDTFYGSLTGDTYVSGSQLLTGQLQVQLGGIDDNTVVDMSGGWMRRFAVSTTDNYEAVIRYNLTQTTHYDPDEYSEILLSVDGVLLSDVAFDYLAKVEGDADGDITKIETTGWTLARVDLGQLSAGTHTLIIGGYNNEKSRSNESTKILIDDIGISLPGEYKPDVVALSSYDGLKDTEFRTFKTIPVKIKNEGDWYLQSTSATYSGDENNFAVNPYHGWFNIAAGDSFEFEAAFYPPSVNLPTSPDESLKTLTMQLVLNDPNNPVFNMTFTGSGQAIPHIELVQSDYQFTPVVVGGVSLQTIQVKNKGTKHLSVSSQEMLFYGASHFSVQSGGAPFTVNAGGSHDIIVKFNPDSTGGMYAEMKLLSDDPDNSNSYVSLRGFAQSPQNLVFTDSLDFDEVTVGDSLRLLFTMENDGDQDLTISNTGLTGANTTDFILETEVVPFTIEPHSVSYGYLTFRPLTGGAKTVAVSITSDDPNQSIESIPVTGSGIEPDIAATVSFDFGDVTVRFDSTDTLQITNPGQGVLLANRTSLFGINSSNFTIFSGAAPFQVAPGDTHEIAVNFLPDYNGAKTATLRIESNDPDEDPFDIALDGKGVIQTGGVVFTYNPTDDAYTSALSDTTNYGLEDKLVVGPDHIGLLKFDITGLVGTVQDAKIYLRTISIEDSTSSDVTVYNLSNDYNDASGPWLETGVDDINAPVIGTSIETNPNVQINQEVILDVTSAISGNATYSFALQTGDSLATQYFSAEGYYPVELRINTTGGYAPPSAPSNLALDVLSSKEINLKWTDNSNNREGFVIERKTAVGAFALLDTVSYNTRKYSDSGLSLATSYTYKVKAYNNSDASVFSSEVSATSLSQYTLSTSVPSNGAIEVSPDGPVYDDSTLVFVRAVPDAGYQLSGWSGDLTGTNYEESLYMDNIKSITATFTALPTQYFLNIATTGLGSVTLSPISETYDSGTDVTLTAVPAEGWQFVDWTGDASGTQSPTTVTMSATKNITANFELIPPTQYTLSVSVTGAGCADCSVTPNNGSFNENEVVYLSAIATSSGWAFSQWQGDDTSSENPLPLTMDANKNVTAVFTYQPTVYELIVDVTGSGSVTGSSAAAFYNPGTQITLTATPDIGAVFSGWGGDLSGSTNPATFTMNEDKQIAATFAEVAPPAIPVNLIATENGGNIDLSWNTVNGVQKYLIYRQAPGRPYEKIIELPKNSTTFTDREVYSGEDVFGQILGYGNQAHVASSSQPYAADFQAQYNGNISWTIHQTKGNDENGGITGWVYNYDKANRLNSAKWGYWGASQWQPSGNYNISGLSYDANGNIDAMTRNNELGTPKPMTYNYLTGTNKLDYVGGLNGQGAGNYTYDANGNLEKDEAKLGTSPMTYDYRNLPTTIPTQTSDLIFDYDPSGQRTMKNDNIYARDKDGRIVAVYKKDGTLLYWNVYGLDLLGQKFPK